jgi:hypothetical protein
MEKGTIDLMISVSVMTRHRNRTIRLQGRKKKMVDTNNKKHPLVIGGCVAAVILVICGIVAVFLFKNSDSRPADAASESEETETAAGKQETETGADTQTTEENTEDTDAEGESESEAAVTEEQEEQEEQTAFEPIYLIEQTTYSCDLDCDGTPEEIYYETYTDFEDTSGCETLVYVNGECVIDFYDDGGIGASVTICDFDNQDAYREIGLDAYWESGCMDYAVAYRYSKGNVAEYYNVGMDDVSAVRWSLDLNQPGDGTVCYDEEYSGGEYLGQGYVHHIFSVKNGKLVAIPANFYDTADDWKEATYYALFELPLLSDVGGTKNGDVVKKGECFYVQQIYLPSGNGELLGQITYIYVITESGKSGWIEVPDEYFYETDPGSGFPYVWG